MKKALYLIICIVFISLNTNAQETKTAVDSTSTSNYIEFNDNTHTVNGVYLGLTFYYGEIDGKSSFMNGLKIAYVANQKFEVGISGVGFFSNQNNNGPLENNGVFGGYGGIYLVPIFFGGSTFSLTMPITIGAGAVVHSFDDWHNIDHDYEITAEDWDPFFVFEPGLSLEYNISNNLKFEMGVKYRVTSEVNLYPGSIQNVNGFSGGIGLKIGVFNLGKKG